MLEAGVPVLAGGGGGKGQRGWLPTASRGAEDGEDGVRDRPGGEGGSVFVPVPRAAVAHRDRRQACVAEAHARGVQGN